MSDDDRRADDEWRGQVTEQVRAVTERVRDLEADRRQTSGNIADIRTDVRTVQIEQKAMRDDLRELGKTIVKDAEKRVRERDAEVTTLQKKLDDIVEQKGLNRFQWALIIVGALLTAVVGPLIVAALTGHVG